MNDWNLILPTNTPETFSLLEKPNHRLMAGGTDILPRLRRSPGNVPIELIDLSRLKEFRFIRQSGDEIEIGSLTTHAEIAASEIIRSQAPALADAASQIGSVQTRVRGTLGGNLANASPAADTVPPLLCLDATIFLSSQNSTRQVPVCEFFTGPGRTSLQANELIHSVCFDAQKGRYGFVFSKLGRRNGMAIAVVSLAVLLKLEASGKIQKIRIALGSVAPTAVRCQHAEKVLIDQYPSEALFAQAAAAVQQDISPISDLRATAEYRRHTATVLLERALMEALLQAEKRQP